MSETIHTSGGIAIIGMAGRFPGARDLEAYWKNLRDGVESIVFFTDEELLAAGVDPELLADPNYVRAGSILEGTDLFDAAHFGINRREAELIDPQHRLFLECAWETLENAGYDPEQYAGAIGVYAGMRMNTYLWQNLAANRAYLEGLLHFSGPNAFLTYLCSDKDFLTSRVAYKMNLRGPAVTVQAACATALVAVCQACESLLSYGSDMALAGGSSVTFPQIRGHLSQEGGMVSSDGHTRPFDAQSSGTIFGSGVGLVLLKRLEDAIKDRDSIHAVIKGAALNNDGAQKVSFSAPAINGQAEVIHLAQAIAGVDAGTLGYIEAHGTATPLGDPIEIAGLTQAFRQTTDKTGFCSIGSVKSNIGHLDAAAGIAGLLKSVLAIERGLIPPTLHYTAPNPNIDFASSPFYVNTELAEWPRLEGAPRRGGISSFGVGGTNAHVVFEEAPALSESTLSSRPQLLVLSARTASALEKVSDNLAAHLRAHPDDNLADLANTLRVGRRAFPHRRTVVARTAADAAAALEARDAKRVFTTANAPTTAPVVFLFPGQGAQSLGMGRELYATEQVFAREFDRCAELLRPLLERDLREIVHPAPGREDEAAALLGQTRYTQPALFAMGYALAQLWMSWGVQPQAMAGHSVGEYVAACLAGVFTLEDALRLVARRAQLVQETPGGAMLAVRLSEDELRACLPAELSIAAINAPSLCVAAGPHEVVADFEARLLADGVAARRLATSHAFHSAMVEPVVAPFMLEVEKIVLHAPRLPFVSCVTGEWMTPELATSAEYWARHLRAPVRFAAAVQTLCADSATVLLEVGPGQTLAPLVRQHPSRAATQPVLASLPDAKDEAAGLARSVGQLWLAGVRFDWAAFVAHEDRRRVPLPTYPFERERFWVEPVKGAQREPLQALTSVMETDGPMPATASEAALPQASDVLSEIKVLLAGLSGLNLDAVPAATTFLDLGFDSLFLTQVSGALQKRFQTKITFRQLLNELPNFEALAEYIQAHRPAATTPAAAPIALPKTTATVALQPVAHGPFRPLQKELAGGLTPRQQAFLDEFIPRYNLRTTGSKRATQEHRAHFADPRAVAGFKQAWKELIYPLVVNRSAGSKLWDIDGNEYVDVTCGFGVAFFGHQPKFVTDAISTQLARGMEIGPASPLAGEVAALVCAMTGLERATFCNTGSEAVTGALRVARTVTGRDKIAMFAGAYHGISDEILVRPRTPGDTQPVPITAGIPAEMSANLILLEYGDPSAFEVIRAHAGELAAVIVEPVQSRRPEFQPREFLQQLRAVTAEHDIALIFDEIISGFRAHPAGAQGYFGVRADLATYGKVIGGGLPIGVIAGTAKYMDAFDGGTWQFGDDSFPATGVTFFAGTFARHPLALAAAKAVLMRLREDPEIQQRLSERTAKMMTEIAETVAGTPFEVPHFASSYYVRANDFPYSGLLFALLREKGLHIWENRPCFISTAHSDDDLAKIVSAFRESIAELRETGFFATTAGGNEIPITDSQRELWVVCQQSPRASTACNETWTLHLDGALDVAAFRRAAQTIVDRHDSLRCTFSASGDTLVVVPKLALDLPLVDLSTLAGSERDARYQALCAAEAQRVFDLQCGPLLRLQLIRFGAERHALLFNAHHLICDGWSCDVFLHELATLYSQGAGPSLPVAMQMRGYQRWEAALHETPEFAADAAFWLEKYRTIPPTLELPGDRPYPRWREYRGATEIALLPTELPQALAKLGARHGVTLFSVLLAGFKALLFRLTGQTDLSVGVPSSGQNLAGGDDLIGHCVNMLPMRTPIDGGQPFGEFAKVVQTSVLEAFEHQRVTFGWLLQHLSLPRVPGRIPLIPVTFNLDPPLSHIQFAGLEHRLEANPRSAFQFDLGFNCDTTPRGLRLICNYSTDLFDAATIRRWLGAFRALLESVVANPAQPLSALPVEASPSAQSAVVPEEWHGAARTFPAEQGVHEIFEAQVARTRDAVAIEAGSDRVSYAELNDRANRLARRLRELGVDRGVCVGLCLERSIDLIAGLLGILKAGGVYLPLDPSYPASRLALMLAETGAPLVLAQRATSGALPASAARVVEIESLDLTNGDALNLGLPSSGDDVAYVMFTSGSTGTPKGAEIRHRGISRLVINTDYVSFTANDAVAQVSNTSFDASTFEIWGALLNGARLLVVPKEALLAPRKFTEDLHRRGATILFLTTPLFHQFAREVPGEFGFLRYLVVGGDALSPNAARAVLASGRAPANLVNGYGPTETTTFAICHRVERVAEDSASIPIGRPIANTRVYLLDPAGAPVPVGEPGEIYIGGPGVARGYIVRPEQTAASFVRDVFSQDEKARLYRTGDRARWLPGGIIEFLGRFDEQVKVRGFRVELSEIEGVLRRHPAVEQGKVVALENGQDGKSLAGYVTARAGSVLQPDEVRKYLSASLPEFMVPATITVLENLPLNANGKLDLQALPAAAADPSARAKGTPLEQRIAAVWSEVLGRNHLSLDDDFFLVGGHSLLAIRLIARLREQFSVDVPVQQLFETPTISGLAEFVAARLPTEAALESESLVVIQRGDESRAPLFLVPGGWGGEVEFLVYRQFGQQLDPTLPLYGLRARGSSAESLPSKSVEEFAAGFVAEICALHPEGPYLIGGECVGGIIAYEMARQLEASGREVALVALLGTEWPNRQSLKEFVAWERKKRRDAVWDARVRQPAGRHWEQLGRLSWAKKLRYLWDRVRRSSPVAPFQGQPDERAVLTEYPRKLMAHTPKTYRGKVTLILDQTAHERCGQAGWDVHHPGALEMHLVPGDHHSYIREHSAATAATLRGIIDRACPAPASC